MELIPFALMIILLIDAAVAGFFSEIATEKGFSGAKYFWCCFLFSFAGYLMVVALPDRNASKQPVVINNAETSAAPQIPSAELPDL